LTQEKFINKIEKMKKDVKIDISNIPDKYKKWLLLNYGREDSEKVLIEEENLAFQVGKGKLPPVLEIWIPSRECFVLGKNFAKRLKKRGLMDRIRAAGVPLILRSSGGEAIFHDSTCLNFGAIVPRKFYPDLFDIGKAFILLSSGVVYYLKKMKIPVYFGKTRTFCPGSYDLLVRERKIAGLSLLLRQNFCLVHGTLFVNTRHGYLEKIKVFYPSLDEKITSIKALTGKRMHMNDVADGIIQGYKASLKITFCN